MPHDTTGTGNASDDAEKQGLLRTAARPGLRDAADSVKPETAKESYADYVKNLPPPFWETKAPRTKPVSDEAIAARVNAVCAPVTAAQREEDARVKAMSLRERLSGWKARRGSSARSKDPDLRPVERGSRAQLNVFGANLTEKRGKR
jgi:hypothetical protein